MINSNKKIFKKYKKFYNLNKNTNLKLKPQ